MQLVSYTTTEIVIAFGLLAFLLVGCVVWFYISSIYKDKRFKELVKVAKQQLKRELTLPELLQIRLAYHRLDYDTVLGIITGVYLEVE